VFKDLIGHNTNCSKVQPIKILHLVTRSDTIGGVHVNMIDVIHILERKGAQSIVLAGNSATGLLFSRLSMEGVPYIPLKFLTRPVDPILDLFAIIELAYFLFKSKPDLVHIHSSKAGIVGRVACFITNTRCIFTVHGWSFAHLSGLNKFFFRLLESILSRIPEEIVCVSRRDLDLSSSLFLQPRNISVIYNTSFIKPGERLKSHDSTQLGVLGGITIKFLCVARLDQQKDHESLLVALSLLPNSIAWSLDIVGDGPRSIFLRDLVARLGIQPQVHFYGHLDDCSNLYANADVFVLSSHYESLPITIIEAMKSCLPVLATDVGGCNEMIIPSFNGYLVPLSSPSVLARRILDLILDPRSLRRMGLNSKLVFDRVFAETIFIDRVAELYGRYLPQANFT
jgi:glycosyltransferase involved in cell wall biosynthesis